MATGNTIAGPGKRLYNPLGNFSSYTYQLSLYMVTPEAYNAFIESNRKNINISTASKKTGTYIVAQSGGINKTTTTRAPGFDLDYYIDDLKITSSVNALATQTSSNTTSLSFQIYEPYGFSFITNLKNAQDELQKTSTSATSTSEGFSKIKNSTRHIFIIGIKFQGYDQSGKVVTSNDAFSQTLNTAEETSGVFEHFYEITLTSIKFKIDGKMTVYSIVAATLTPATAFGAKKGRVDNDISLTATNVGEALKGSAYSGGNEGVRGLIEELNKKQQELFNTKGADGKPGCKIPNKYSIEFIGKPGEKDSIPESSLNLLSDTNKLNSSMTAIKSSNDSNSASSEKALPNLNLRTIKIPKGISVMQAISNVIKQSRYVADALSVLYKSSLEEETDGQINTGKDNSNPSSSSPTALLKWYNLGAEVKSLGWDEIVGDFAFDIKYIIQPYSTPATVSPYSKIGSKYPGPYKKYEYWYTGKNSEILSYEHTLNNAYFKPTVTPSGTKDSHLGNQDVPNVGNKENNADGTGFIDKAQESVNSYLTILTDPVAYAKAKISILGDPDFLMRDSPDSLNQVYNQYYQSNGFTINPNASQMFIEIKFNEGRDYINTTGLMKINSNILFWDYPDPVKKLLKGYISYMVLSVVSIFSKGKFTQELDCTINPFPLTSIPISSENTNPAQTEREPVSDTAGEGNRTSTSLPASAGNSSLGLTPDTPVTPGLGGGVSTTYEPPQIIET